MLIVFKSVRLEVPQNESINEEIVHCKPALQFSAW